MQNYPNVVLFADITGVEWFSRGYGAYRIASEIREHGYTVLTVDFSTFLDWDTFTKIIDQSVGPETLLVGFSSTWFPFRNGFGKEYPNPRQSVGVQSKILDPATDLGEYDGMAYKISQGHLSKYVDYIKKTNAKTKVVLGGAKAFEYVQETSLDNLFIGYGENTIIEYLNSISRKGTQHRLFNKIIDYDVKAQLGKFDFNKSITSYVDTDCVHPDELGTIEFSRGCIFNCSFCSYPHRNQDTRNYVKYKETIYKELLDNYIQWGLHKYVITDDTFNDYTEKLQLIKEVIDILPFKPKFWAYVRLDIVARHPEQAQLLKDIGVKEIFYGLDAWHDDTARRIKKGGSRSKKIDGIKIAKECWGNDVYIMAGIVIGLPLDTVASLQEAIEWYKDEGHKYIDMLAFTSLALRSGNTLSKYLFASDIEQNFEEYNYSFPDPINEPLEWVRNDSGDIYTKAQADQLMNESFQAVAPYWNQNMPWDKRLPGLTEMFVQSGLSKKEMIYNYVITKYFPTLLTILETKVWK
jgi:radical SAM superfamily enzyme